MIFETYPCLSCKYFETSCRNGNATRTEYCDQRDLCTHEEYVMRVEADRKKTENFYKDLVGSCKGTQYKYEICVDEMAELMHISLEEADDWEDKLILYKITERQNGGIVTNA